MASMHACESLSLASYGRVGEERREATGAASRRVFYATTGMMETPEDDLLLRKARNFGPCWGFQEIG